MIDRRPRWKHLRAGDALVEQGQTGAELYLLFDGVMHVDIDDDPVTVVGPGALLGEQAVLGDGVRTATLRALTACRVGVFTASDVAVDALRAIADTRPVPTPQRG